MEEYKILKDLVKFNTIKDKENKEIMNYIENYLLKLGFKTESKTKNLVMSYGENPTLGFLGHTDTVEYIDGWNTSPFELTIKENNIYGLGACDMKGGVAAILDAVSKINLKNLQNGLKLYFTYDEEIGFGGVYELSNNNEKFPPCMLFGEPTNNEMLVGSKGLLEIELNFIGKKAHSSNPAKGISANLNAVRYLSELENFYLEKIKIDENTNYEVPYTAMNVGLINGGSAKNSIPASCYATIDFRIIKEEHLELLKNKLEELAKKYNCEVSIIEEIKPFISKTNLVDKIKTANFMTEASFLEAKEKVILGPGPITAHEVNEYITKESYNKLVKQYIEIINKKCNMKSK